MTELKRTNPERALNYVTVEPSSLYDGKVLLKLTHVRGSHQPLAVALDEREIDDLIVMLEYHKREANNEIAEKQEGQDPD